METLLCFCKLPQPNNSISERILRHKPLQESNRRLLAAAVSISLISSFPSAHAQAHTLPIQHLHVTEQTWLLPEFETKNLNSLTKTSTKTRDVKTITKTSAKPSIAEKNGVSEDPIALRLSPAKSPSVRVSTDEENAAPRVISTMLQTGSVASGIVVEATLAGTEAAAGSSAVAGCYQTLIRVLQHFSASGIAGAVGAAVVYPLDTIKTRMQAQSPERGEEPEYKDEMDCFRKLVTNEGPASLYIGLIPQLLGIAPEKALKLTVNEALLSILEQSMPGVSIWMLEFIAGGGGGFSQAVVTNPMEIVKIRLQTQSKIGVHKNSWAVVKDLGLEGLYDGCGITMARDVPSSAVFFAFYTLLRQLYPDQSFLDGCIAAIPATILVTPFDVIKTRLQMEPYLGEEPYKSPWHCLKCIWQREGPRALFKGNLVRVLKTSPQFGITLLLYNYICEEH